VLLKNLGNLKFKEANKEVGLPGDVFASASAVADVNGDGRPDFFVPHSNAFSSHQGRQVHESAELKKVFAWEAAGQQDWPAARSSATLPRRPPDWCSASRPQGAQQVFITRRQGRHPPIRDVSKEVGMPPSSRAHARTSRSRISTTTAGRHLSLAAWLDKDGASPRSSCAHGRQGWPAAIRDAAGGLRRHGVLPGRAFGRL